MSDQFQIQFKNIKLVVCDFDGVMTDNRVIVDEDGKESVFCSRSDGFGIEQLKKNDIDVIVISKETNKVVAARCKKLSIPCIHGIEDKITILKKELLNRNISSDEVCYIGNDINDIECMKHVIGVAVKDAHEKVKNIAQFITEKNGGFGAVREIADLILADI